MGDTSGTTYYGNLVAGGASFVHLPDTMTVRYDPTHSARLVTNTIIPLISPDTAGLVDVQKYCVGLDVADASAARPSVRAMGGATVAGMLWFGTNLSRPSSAAFTTPLYRERPLSLYIGMSGAPSITTVNNTSFYSFSGAADNNISGFVPIPYETDLTSTFVTTLSINVDWCVPVATTGNVTWSTTMFSGEAGGQISTTGTVGTVSVDTATMTPFTVVRTVLVTLTPPSSYVNQMYTVILRRYGSSDTCADAAYMVSAGMQYGTAQFGSTTVT
jgi:hypothetical protein